MEISSIIGILTPIIVGIMTIAYPIILKETSDIGGRYKSEYITQVFEKEFFNKPIKCLNKKITLFQCGLYTALLSQIFLIFSFEAPAGWNYWLVNNSAYLIVFLTTFIMTFTFFFWLNSVSLYTGKTKRLLQHLIKKFKNSKSTEAKQIILKSINDIAISAIDKQDIRIEEDLLKFYMEYCILFRKEYNERQN